MFIYISTEQSKKGKKAISFIIASKRIEYLEITLTTVVKDLYGIKKVVKRNLMRCK